VIGHYAPVSGVDTLGDRLVATAGYDNQVILWDAASRMALARGVHDHLANHCRFSGCGRYLVSASSDYTARVWTVPGLRLHSVLGPHDDDVEMAAFDPAGERVATASRDGSLRVFTRDGRLLRRLRGHSADVLSVEWVDGGHLASSSDDGTVRRWDPDGGRLLDTLDFGGVETDTFAFMPAAGAERGRLCVGNDRGELTLVSGDDRRVMRCHDAGIKRVVAGPDDLVLTTSYDRTAKLWRARPGADLDLMATVPLPLTVWPRSAGFIDAGRLVFGTFGSTYACLDVVSRRWDLSGVRPTPGINGICVDGGTWTVGDAGIVRRDGQAVGEVGSLCNFLVAAGGRVLTGGQAGRLFDARTAEVVHEHRSPLNCAVSFTTAGQGRLAVGTYTGEALVFDVSGPSLTHLATVALHDNAVKALAANGTHLLSVCATGAAGLHALATMETILDLPSAHTKIANGAAVLPDGRFVSVGRDLMLRTWSPDMSTAVKTPHDHSVKCVAASPTGSLLVTGAYDGTVAVYDWRREEWVGFERPTTSGISCVAAAPEPGVFLAGSYDGQVYRVAAR
jgi:WD40 repeat protein